MKKRISSYVTLFLAILLLPLSIVTMPTLEVKAADDYTSLKNTTTVVRFDNKEWYLIDYDDTTLTLLSKECVIGSSYGYGNTYSGSTVETAVNSYYENDISAIAKVAVYSGKMFLLTRQEVGAITNVDIKKCSSTYSGWWLNSSDSGTYGAPYIVNSNDGSILSYGGNLSDTLGVRPALKLNRSSVIFSSDNNTFTIATLVTGITLDKTTTQTINIDDSIAFTATVSPDDATYKTVKWSTNSGNVKLYSDASCTTEVGSAATDVLTVYAKGITAGDATVTVTSNADAALTAGCDVTVNKLAGTISYATTSVSKKKGDSAFTNELSKTGDGTTSYSSDKESVATVDGTGKVTIVGAGEANITATVTDSAKYTYATKTATYKLTVTETAVSTAEYSVTSDSTSEWTLDSGVDITVTVKRSADDASCFSHFDGVQIDGKALTADDYTAKSGSTIVTLKASVLQKLTAGEHTVTVLFDDGKADMILTVKEKVDSTDTTTTNVTDNSTTPATVVTDKTNDTTNSTTTASSDKAKSPTTGDKMNIVVIVMLMIDTAFAAIYLTLRKKKIK